MVKTVLTKQEHGLSCRLGRRTPPFECVRNVPPRAGPGAGAEACEFWGSSRSLTDSLQLLSNLPHLQKHARFSMYLSTRGTGGPGCSQTSTRKANARGAHVGWAGAGMVPTYCFHASDVCATPHPERTSTCDTWRQDLCGLYAVFRGTCARTHARAHTHTLLTHI